jgi:hypothetical protein
MKAPPVAASEALGGCSLSEAESCKAIYADLRPPWILARETIHNKRAVGEPNPGQSALATRRAFLACPTLLRAVFAGRSGALALS